MRTKIVFHVDAGRFESDGEKNYKYCDQSETLAGAIQMYEMALGYEFVDFYLVITFPNGAKRTVYLDGGDYAEERMRMSIANLWMQVMGNDFFDLTEGPTWEQQIEVIEGVLEARAHFGLPEDQQVPASRAIGFVRAVHRRLFDDDTAEYLPMAIIEQEISSKITELQRTKRVWQDIHARFHNHSLTWTQAFDALMSECGLPMEEALRCLAEHFNRRPVITATEV